MNFPHLLAKWTFWGNFGGPPQKILHLLHNHFDRQRSKPLPRTDTETLYEDPLKEKRREEKRREEKRREEKRREEKREREEKRTDKRRKKKIEEEKRRERKRQRIKVQSCPPLHSL
ncbi:hypothetical protein DUI87_19518 [Hirundo rustica rustica]|uniref:Uncharacterized protein n=1 Tax=Hirundo rustica rustica TaxID=333673 RepID=A0A3M0JSP6_HIRRU|nr:hypothetical protein DUI87_19518 [Hirundo rustica rustica]